MSLDVVVHGLAERPSEPPSLHIIPDTPPIHQRTHTATKIRDYAIVDHDERASDSEHLHVPQHGRPHEPISGTSSQTNILGALSIGVRSTGLRLWFCGTRFARNPGFPN